MRRPPILAGLAAAVLLATPAAADLGAGFPVKAVVPVVCVSEFEPAAAPEGDPVFLGELNERCNAVSGYQVYVDHPPGLAGVAMILDGRAIHLDASGHTLVVDNDRADIRSHGVYLLVAEGAPPLDAADFRFEQPAPKS